MMYRIRWDGAPHPLGALYISEKGKNSNEPLAEVMTLERLEAATWNGGDELEKFLEKLQTQLHCFVLEIER